MRYQLNLHLFILQAIGLDKKLAPEIGIVAQLIWREYFYTMSAQNIYYGQMEKNPICLQIPWYKNEELNKKIELVSQEAEISQLLKAQFTSHECRVFSWSGLFAELSLQISN